MSGTTEEAPDRDLSAFPIVEEEPRGQLLTAGRVLLGAIVLASFAVWAYAFSGFADREAPDTLSEAGFAAAGDAICAVRFAEFDAVPNALDAESEVERSAQITQANDVLRAMVTDLRAEVSGDARDVQISEGWLDDWDTYIGNRQDFADRLATDPQAVLYVAAVGGERLEKRITRLAETNKMYNCITPSDVG